MVATIGVMIGAYIIARMLEMAVRSEELSSTGAKILIGLAAAACIMVALVGCVLLIAASVTSKPISLP